MSEATPMAPSGITPDGAPYGIGEMVVPAGLTRGDLVDRFLTLPERVGGLPLADVVTSGDNVTAVFVDETLPEAPRFAMAVASRVTPTAEAGAFLSEFVTARWGDPAEREVSAAGDGDGGLPAYVAFARSFAQGQFLLPYRLVYFLLWYRGGDEYAFSVIGDTAANRAALATAVAVVFAPEEKSG